ncbi:MAG: tetratricopeptide repeat protein [Planctomycetia bacterium]|nr:tetratricopeptide repeat protein [Planctomycetia bacterium]
MTIWPCHTPADLNRCAPRCASRVACRWAALCCLALCAATTGCHAWPWRAGPVTPEVAASRDLSAQGQAAIDQGEWRRAEDLLARSVKACPSDAETRRRYAETLARRGAMPEALAQMDEAQRLSANDVMLAVRCGEMYLGVGELDAAQRRADRAVAIDPTSADAWALRGRVMAARGDLPAALADTQRALGYRRDDRQLLYATSEIYSRLKRPDRSLMCLESLAETYPAGEEPQQLLVEQGQMLAVLNRHGEAAQSFERALRRGRPTAELHLMLANAYLAAGRFPQAQQSAAEAMVLEPNSPQGRQLMARLAAGTGADVPRR